MSSIGETKRASELGYKGHAIYVYIACSSCGKLRWTRKNDARSCCRHCGWKASGLYLNTVASLQTLGAKKASELGKHLTKDIWLYPHLCSICGKETWHKKSELYRACSPECALSARQMPRAEKHHAWKGGRCVRTDGYISVLLQPNSPYYPMTGAGRGMVMEHRLVMAQYLGRCLETWEIVHHKNSDRADNRMDNLELLPSQSLHLVVIQLQKEVDRMQAEVKLLKWHIKDLRHGNAEPSSPKSSKVGEKV